MRILFILALGLISFQAQAATAWLCDPKDASQKDPRIAIARGKTPGTAVIWLEADLKRAEGTIPAGEYPGTLSTSASGQSATLKMDTSKFFPNTDAPTKGTELSMALSLTNKAFVAEAYILWPCESGTCPFGMILNEFGCRVRP